jgi:hypothetical protein
LNDPAVTTVGCPDDGSVVASGSSHVGIRERHTVEGVTLRERILPDPLRAAFDRILASDTSLRKCGRDHIGHEREQADDYDGAKEICNTDTQVQPTRLSPFEGERIEVRGNPPIVSSRSQTLTLPLSLSKGEATMPAQYRFFATKSSAMTLRNCPEGFSLIHLG